MIPLRIFWRATPSAVKWAALGALVLALAFAAGRYAGGQARDLDAAERRIENINDAREIERDVEALDDDAFRNDLERRLLPSGK